MFRILILLTFVLSACGPSAAQIGATATAKESERLLAVEHYYQTATAEAKMWAEATPRATLTPDIRSDSEKRYASCTQYSGVHYILRGDAKSVSVTWQNDQGGTSQGDYLLPFCIPFPNFVVGDFLYISAQIDAKGGRVECLIYDGERKIAQAQASGQFNIATCNGEK